MNMLMNGVNPVGMVYNQSAENIAYDSNNSVKDKIDDIANGIELLADCTQADTEYDLAKNLSNYKYILATSYLFNNDNNSTYYLASTIIPISNLVYNATFIICALNDGTLRKGQLGVKSSSKIFSTPTGWTNITGIKVYGIK